MDVTKINFNRICYQCIQGVKNCLGMPLIYIYMKAFDNKLNVTDINFALCVILNYALPTSNDCVAIFAKHLLLQQYTFQNRMKQWNGFLK